MTTMTASVLGLKEWGAAVHALLDGRQTVLLRKGGIHEKAFSIGDESGRFILFPTVAHSHRERVRREHAGLLALGEADVREDDFTVRCGVRLVESVAVQRPERLPAIADLHIWTQASVRRDRVEFRPRQPLQVLVVQAVALPEPVRVPRLDSYAGCRSWIELPPLWDGRAGVAVHPLERLESDAVRVRQEVA